MVTKCGAEQFLHNVEDFTARYFLIQLNIVPLLTHTPPKTVKKKKSAVFKNEAKSVNAIPPKKLLNFFFISFSSSVKLIIMFK